MKIYRINMNDLSIKTEEVPREWNHLGGRALTSAIVAKEVDPTCHPLGAKNKLVFAPGLLTGTSAPNSGRMSFGAKSPLTGGIKESNSGGSASQKLAKLGVKAVIIEGLPAEDKFYNLHIDNNGIKIEQETELLGKGNYEVIDRLSKKYGDKIGVITIGQAGEYKLCSANISVKDYHGNIRSAGRGGLGAVMSSKKIKYITIDDTGAPGVTVANPEKFKEASRLLAKSLKEHPVTGQGLPTYGTNILVNILNEAGGLPTRNFRMGRFAGANKISGEAMYETILNRKGKPTHNCHAGCVISCSQVYHDAEGKFVTAGFEYETIWGFGAVCYVDDLDIIAQADRICDDIGIDTIETAVAIATAMEGGLIPFGDGQGMLNLLREIEKGSPLGRIIGNGAGFTGKAFGVTRVAVVKNQAIPAYDPRAVKGVGVTYATTPMGADHTAGYAVATNILQVGGHVNPLAKEGNVDLSRNLQIATAALDALGLCLFVAFSILDNPDAYQAIVELVNAQYNLNLTENDMTTMGQSVLHNELEFNKAAGFTAKDDQLPEFFNEQIPPHNTTWDFTTEELQQVFNA
ncbi:aldehyde ferredoxin oxidoreductase family protein [Desulfoscipio gibsoniae]|uniref:Aldehyde:ferredoxin oxidoreductase n=1 Tax=Desulfoscipio gibsoniae DSM 7213 TaxID=767817 RepID=R4KMH1_9FIRM|nr:aldehyde ferredoxin oxidoreductase C-terminal domain-containing protein [Desulfoscipio gibsoniae]AGL01735.1 aldehyde:ferredoxin oxidoreductase [Desulfoscipio gibsoniae DSM 7213]